MPRKFKSLSFVIVLILSSFMLTGCWNWKDYSSNDDEETGNTTRTFAISDSHPYPGKGHQISDKLVDNKYTMYIYIVNNGGQEKDNKTSASNIKLTLIDETNSKTIDVGTKSISEGVGYVMIPDLSYDRAATVHLHVEGNIYKNGKPEFVKVNSNSFNINNKPKIVQSISVTPNNSTVQVGLTKKFTASAINVDGSTQDVSEIADWTSIEVVGKATMVGRYATGFAEGATTIKATFGGKSGTASLTIIAAVPPVPPVLNSIRITPLTASIQVGQTQTFTAEAVYSNGFIEEVMADNWSSTNENYIQINSQGVATGVAAPGTTIKGTYKGISGIADLTVSVVPPAQGPINRLIWENEIVDE